MNYLEQYYSSFDEEGRLLSRHGQVEYLTTMKYIHDFLYSDTKKRILEVGAGTGRYCIKLAQEGYQLDAMELTDYNLNILLSKSTKQENLTVVKGNALDLSNYSDKCFDMTLLLGPLYHLPCNADKMQALQEAVRVTKPGGIIMAAYCMNDPVVIQEGFIHGNVDLQLPGNALTTDFHCISKPEDVFAVVRLDEIHKLTEDLPVLRLKTIATDGATNYLREFIDNMDDDTFARWLEYHFSICERQDLIGASNHSLDILQRQ